MAQNCPYIIPYIPDGDWNFREKEFSIYLRFQASLFCTPTKLPIYGFNYCWLWLDNICKILKNSTRNNLNVCFVLREFFIKIESHLLINDAKRYLDLLNQIENDILPRLDGRDPSKNALGAYINDFRKRNIDF